MILQSYLAGLICRPEKVIQKDFCMNYIFHVLNTIYKFDNDKTALFDNINNDKIIVLIGNNSVSCHIVSACLSISLFHSLFFQSLFAFELLDSSIVLLWSAATSGFCFSHLFNIHLADTLD